MNPQTVVELKGANAAYARAFVEGSDLSQWRGNPDWYGPQTRKTRAAARKWAEAFSFDGAHRRMVQTAFDTALRSNGQQVLRTVKNKKVVELTREELDRYTRDLFDEQSGLCRLTGLKLQHDDGLDPALRCSLDRIDSNGHYEKNNLQIVCRFANTWKSDSENAEFLRLVRLLRAPALS